MDDIGFWRDFSGAGDLASRFLAVRGATEALVVGLTDEGPVRPVDAGCEPGEVAQAHTTWFFEQFVLVPHVAGYRVFDPAFGFLFNSYYEAVGPRHPRPSRGLLTRPSADEVTQYRRHVDDAVAAAAEGLSPEVIAVGRTRAAARAAASGTAGDRHVARLRGASAVSGDGAGLGGSRWVWRGRQRSWRFPVGWRPRAIRAGGFCFDNETPRHPVYLAPYALASRLVRNRDWLDFIADRGYETPSLWMSDGWATVREAGWSAPLHWREGDGVWLQAGPSGLAAVNPDAPVRHISWYEADAFARWE